MSIVYTLKKLVDPVRVRMEETERKRLVEVGESEKSEDAKYRCRVCGLESRSNEYCPACLADTMETVRQS
ncbi:hypothetical protein KKF34_02105 [Myxococcota bacterium]|nr:hypothetical protein [Myxococcota bacterium]MBU1379812.1 hypothetical protein [Myxococcota bacterium]MBU1495654.1 hypothetical protein [Myxococcota bacterium]